MLEISCVNSFKNIPINSQLFESKSIFLNPAFLESLEVSNSVGQKTGWQPFYLLALRDKKLVGFMPTYIKDHSYGEYVFDWAWADAFHRYGLNYYPKILCAIPFTPLTGTRLLAEDNFIKEQMIVGLETILKDNNLSSCHILFLNNDDHELFKSFGWMTRRGVQFRWVNNAYKSFENFISHLSHNKRKKIKQERAKIKKANIEIIQKIGSDIEREDIEFFYECYCNTYFQHHSRPYLTREFFVQLHKKIPEKLLFVIANRDSRSIAVALNIMDKDTLYGRYWGALEYIPNLHFELCYYQGQEFCIQNNIKFFEGGAQGEHKLARGFEAFDTFSCHYIVDEKFREAIKDFLAKESEQMELYTNELDIRKPFKKISHNLK